MSIINILDIYASTMTVLSLFMIKKSRYWWIAYASAAIAFTIVCISYKIIGLTCMGICLFIVGIKNFKETE